MGLKFFNQAARNTSQNHSPHKWTGGHRSVTETAVRATVESEVAASSGWWKSLARLALAGSAHLFWGRPGYGTPVARMKIERTVNQFCPYALRRGTPNDERIDYLP